MPRIPIADIPNAPGAGQPVLTSANTPKISLGYAAKNLQQEGLPVNAFSGTGQGIQAIGGAVAKAGDVLGDWSIRLSQIRDANAEAEASAIFDQTKEQMAQKMATTTPDKWVESLKGMRSDVLSQVAKIDASPEGKSRLAAEMNRSLAKYESHVGTQAVIQGTRIAEDNIDKASARDVKNGNFESAFAWQDKKVSLGMQTEETAAINKKIIEDEQVRQGFDQMLVSDPIAMNEAFKEYKETGKGPGASVIEKLTPIQQKNYEAKARQATIQTYSDTLLSVKDGIKSGTITDESQIDQFSRELGEHGVKAAKEQLANVTGRPLDYPAYVKLDNAVSLYDRSADPDGKRRLEIQQQIVGQVLPDDKEKDLIKRLDGEATNTKVESLGVSQVNSMLNDNFFGRYDKKASKKDRDAAALQAAKYIDQVRKFAVSNPNATETDMQEFVNTLTSKNKETAHWYNPASWFNSDPALPAPNDALKILNK